VAIPKYYLQFRALRLGAGYHVHSQKGLVCPSLRL
jgi:hypothetical protein